MKRTAILAAVLVATASTISAQDAPARADTATIRDHIRFMEANLTQAVRMGAQTVGRRLQQFEPGSLFVTSDARARGFVLEGYGVFFDVDVPMMRQSVAWSMRTLLLGEQARIANLRAIVATTPDSPQGRAAQMELRELERRQAGPSPVTQSAPRGAVSAATINETESTATTPAPTNAASADLSDPNALYTDSVKNALIDAMLDYSGRLNIGPDEWLTVAARDSEGPIIPNALDETTTIVLRVKGSDLLAYRTNKLTRDEARQKVEVREF